MIKDIFEKLLILCHLKKKESTEDYSKQLRSLSRREKSIEDRLDDICIKHHGSLPYEP